MEAKRVFILSSVSKPDIWNMVTKLTLTGMEQLYCDPQEASTELSAHIESYVDENIPKLKFEEINFYTGITQGKIDAVLAFWKPTDRRIKLMMGTANRRGVPLFIHYIIEEPKALSYIEEQEALFDETVKNFESQNTK